MNKQELKQLMKEAAKEVFQEELKEILLEAIRSPKPIITENQQWEGTRYQRNHNNSGNPVLQRTTTNSMTPELKEDLRNKYMSVLNETATQFTTSDIEVPFTPHPSTDVINGELPAGEVSMNQIMNLMGKK